MQNTFSPILLVEDDANVSLMLSRQLARAGYHVVVAASVTEAHELIREEDWGLAILDRNLPDGDGIDLCRELRAEFPHNYILILTGDSSEESKLEGFECGADDYVTKPFGVQELLARIRAGQRIVELQKALLELTVTDGLTSLKNRRAFDRELVEGFEHARRYERPMSVVVVDVDHFKAINDQYGHPAGDCVLRAVAQVLESGTRASDFVARIGGEEFAILLPESPLMEALQFAEKVRAAVESATIRTAEIAHRVTVSVGVASMPHSHVRSGAELFHAADQALYRAKANGRNRVEIERRRVRFAVVA
jgi:two-component system cell cycle response regulator